MTRPKRAARKRKLTELAVRKLKPKTARLPGLGHPAARARAPGAADRQPGLEVRLLASTAGRAGCTWAMPVRSGWPTPARWRPRPCWRSPGARTRRPRSGPSAAPAPSPSWHSQYVERYAKKRNKSWPQADALVRRYACPRWGKLQAASIARADVRAMMGRIEAPIVANQMLAAVSAVFCWAVKEEILAANPCKLVERNATRSRERVLSDSEVPRFWSAFDDAGLVASSALKMILLTGQRPGECAHMRREHIVDGWWQMPGDPVPEAWLARHQERREPSRVAAQAGAGAASPSWATARPPASCSPGRAVVRCTGSMPRCARPASQARRRAGDAARSAPHSRQHHHRAGLRPRRHEPDPEPQGGRHRLASTTGTDTPTRTSASWRRSRPRSWRWSRGGPDEKVVPIRR